jgi:hypothetical protein
MRTQLQETLRAAGVRITQVRFTVDGRALDAPVVDLVDPAPETGSLVLADGAFGTVVGDEISPVEGISEEILGIAEPIATIDVAADDSRAAVQLTDGRVYHVADGRLDQLGTGASLVPPSLDPYGYTWTVPSTDPSTLQAWAPDVTPHQVVGAWPNASTVLRMRVSGDGARLAAVIAVGGQQWIVVAAIVRDESGVPVELGPLRQLAQIEGEVEGLAWVGDYRLSVLADPDSPDVLTQMVGGVGFVETAPSGATSLAGAPTVTGVRIRGDDGTLFAHAGSAWREVATGIRVLATRAGQ